jgi:tetratricopeptide (TPR) repeat protein
MRIPIEALIAAALLATGAAAQESAAPANSVGVVHFENSGSPQAQAAFSRGLALLHNFEYERAAAEFQSAQAADPGFAMAYWGEAMTHNHPIWMEQDRGAALKVLAKLGKAPKARAKKTKTARERDYFGAVETLYGAGKKEDRDYRYEAAMARLHEKYPDDVDAAAFHALAILGTAHAGRDFAAYMRSAAILEEVYPENRDHPGVLHYLIHSYDDPVHAPLGLRAARRYGVIAPDAGHALHMTSHVFVALGLWDDVISMNEQAISVVNSRRKAVGKDAAFCGHYSSWLVYGYLQKRNIDRARYYIDGCRVLALKELEARAPGSPDPDDSLSGSYFYMRTMLAADTGEWKTEDDVPMENASDWEKFSSAYGALLGANSGDDRAALTAAAAELDRLAPLLMAELEKSGDNSAARHAVIEATRLQGEALVKLRGGDSDGGIGALTAAAGIEASAPVEFGPPFVEKPSHELLGDELMRLKSFDEAAEAYRTALARTPGRTLAIEGLASAERASR